ncbi:MAG TPA: DNA polymerase III subunit alpha, partial [Patescibacteria group bacterium]
MPFVHLHTHSHYSLLDGLAKIDQLVAKAVEHNMPALALTDHGAMYGSIEFYQACLKAGIKPIIGLEAYVAPNGMTNKRPRIDDKRHHLVLLAQNEAGYKNLIKLTTKAHLEGYYYKPRIDWETLTGHKDGLIVLSACLAGEIPGLILNGQPDKARATALKYQETFGPDNFYLEVQRHPAILQQEPVNQALFKIGQELGIDVVATNDIHYASQEDAVAQDTLLCIQTNRKIQETDRMKMSGDDFYFKSPAYIKDQFKDHPEVIDNTLKIAGLCNLELKFGQVTLPYFEVPSGETGHSYLKKLAVEGLKKRYNINYHQPLSGDKEILDRFEYEMSVIEKTGFAPYFLIVQDFVNWAKDQGITVGPGRGSAAGSLVSYATNITNIDPLKYDLLFERFLNPERISMPDIDLDFADTRRDEVIRYVESKYGQDKVAQIITFGTMAARGAIRDAGRALDLPYAYCDQVAKMIPMGHKLNQALEISTDLKALYQGDQDCRTLIDRARKLEGVARHTSTHACGVLITKDSLDNYVPLQYSSTHDQALVSQYSLHPIEDLGLLKMDFLGLKNLTILENAVEIVEKVRGLKVNLDKIPVDDQKTFQLLQRGETTGVFQLESSGMRRYLIQLKPNDFEDIIAMIS